MFELVLIYGQHGGCFFFILTWTVSLVIRFNNSLLKPLPYVRELPLTVGINADVRHLFATLVRNVQRLTR
jgi:hypothetical protein